MVAERVGYAEVQDLRGAAACRPRPKAKGRRLLPVLPRSELGGPPDGLHGLLRHRRRAVDFIHALVHRAAPRLPDPVCAQARAGQHPLRLVRNVAPQADTYAPGPPLGTYRLHVPASRVVYVPEAQGGLPPGPRVLYVRGTRTSLGRTVRTAYLGTPGSSPARARSCRR